MSNVAYLLERGLSPSVHDLLKQASGISANRGVALYLVGGSVRDILIGTGSGDIDLVGEGADANFASFLASNLGGTVLSYSQFHTSKIKVGKVDIDLAATRQEYYSQPGALPTVSPGSIEEDLWRRDFSINAMAIDLNWETWGNLLDPFGGQSDIKRGFVRVLHPNSFSDDPTRSLRAIRYSQRLSFRIDPYTEIQLEKNVGQLSTVSGERIRQEIRRVFMEPKAACVLLKAQEFGLLANIHHSLIINPLLAKKMTPLLKGKTSRREKQLLGLLVYAVPSENLNSLVERLVMDRNWTKVVRDIGMIRDMSEQLNTDNLCPSNIYSMLIGMEAASIESCAILTDSIMIRERLHLFLRKLRHMKPILTGTDLQKIGVPEGPAVGKLLNSLLISRLNGQLTTRGDEEIAVRKSLTMGRQEDSTR